MEEPELKVVGEIKPHDYKDPVQMLRNIADEIEAGKFGDVETLVVALAADHGYEMFGGGRKSSLEECAFLYATAHQRLVCLPWGPAF